jgi:hypothetical protein
MFLRHSENRVQKIEYSILLLFREQYLSSLMYNCRKLSNSHTSLDIITVLKSFNLVEEICNVGFSQ